MTDQQLIFSLQKGSETAYQQMMQQYHEQVFNVCFRYLNNPQDAEDVCQEVFIEVFRSVDNFRQESKLSTWIYRIATTKSLELIRYRERKKRASFFHFTESIDGERAISVSDNSPNPGVQLENKERASILYAHIEKLSGKQRQAFVLHKIEGKSHKEISQIMDNSISSIESLLHRAKKKLQFYLIGYYQMELI